MIALTTSDAEDDKIYQTHPSWTADGKHVVFRSDRTGSWQLFAVEEGSGQITQLTARDGIRAHQVCLSRKRNALITVVENKFCLLELDLLLSGNSLSRPIMKEIGEIPSQAELSGSISWDADEKRLYCGLRWPQKAPRERWSIHGLDLKEGILSPVIHLDFCVGHVQANPFVPGLIMYCHETGGDAPQRMWTVRADGSGNRPLYQETYNEWVTHEVWWDSKRALFAIWPKNAEMRAKPHGIASVSLNGGSLVHSQFPYWHVACTAGCEHAVADTFSGEILQVDLKTGKRVLLTEGHRKERRGLHPHPSLHPKGDRVLFTSHHFGNADIFLVRTAPTKSASRRPIAHPPPGAMLLRENWQLQASQLVTADGHDISSIRLSTTNWHGATVPTTVLSALVRKGVYPNRNVALNDMRIPRAHDGFNRKYDLGRYSHLPEQSNPWAKPRPNIIVIFTDDHGYADLGSQGVLEDVQTPHIDKLAAGGVRMTSGYVTAPQCVPSRAGLLTGRYQNRFGVESNADSLDGFNAEQTLAERLKRAGYATGMTGKWHLGPKPQIVRHGFDDVYFKNANRPGWANFDLDGNDRPPGVENSRLYHLDANSASACAFIKRHHDHPFFFYCAYRAPHVPLDAPPKYLDRFPEKMPERRRQALAMISAIDDGVGRIMSTLRQYNLEEKTLVFFIGDNGAPLKIHKIDAPGGGPGWDGSLNDPLNGEKGMLAEGGIRVPFVVYWKGRLPGGRPYNHPVIALDVTATAIAVAGLSDEPKLDGVNLIPYLSGEKQGAPHDALYWRWLAQSAIRDGKWKYLRGGTREYLFDLDKDPEEKRNILKEHPDIAERLKTRLLQWSSGLNPPGIETKKMSATWERYFDHYLDGKPVPKPSSRSGRSHSASRNRARGWIGRNGTVELKAGFLRVRPAGKKRRPFIATAGLSLPAKSAFMVRLRAENAGTAAVAWREVGQRGFPPQQIVTFACPQSTEWHEHRVKIPARAEVIHVRLLLPPSGADIESIKFADATGKTLRAWRFDKR